MFLRIVPRALDLDLVASPPRHSHTYTHTCTHGQAGGHGEGHGRGSGIFRAGYSLRRVCRCGVVIHVMCQDMRLER